jgi:predicted lipoprotein with Yx(FWY)xxD motif
MLRTSGQRGSWRMSLTRMAAVVVAVGGLSAVVLAPGAATAATTPTTASVISTADNAKLGTILVTGNTVYVLKPSKTACTTTCWKAWPPVLLPHGVKTATAGPGVDASKLGTVAAAKSALQVTYSGKRLYWFAKDKAPGQVHGNVKNEWGKWSTVVMPTAAAAAPTTAPPATAAPATAPPATEAPATSPPATEAPATEPPATEAPATSPPATQPATPPPTNKPSNPGTGGIAF